MLKKILIPIFVSLAMNATAQVDKADDWKKSLLTENKDTVAWIHGGVLTVGMNEGFLHNWPAGGELISMTVNGQFSGYLNYIHHHKIWTNNLDLAYGLFYAYSNSFVPRKVDDRIDFTSKYGVKMAGSQEFYFAGLFNFKSQFTKGFDYNAPAWDSFSTSDFMSPAYFTAALGMEYRKGSGMSVFLSPLALRMTTASKYYTGMKPEGAFGIKNGKTSRFELGAYLSARYQKELSKKMLFRTRLDLYTNYLAKDNKDDNGILIKKDSPGNVDIFCDNFFSYKMGKHISMTVGLTLFYDNDFPYNRYYYDANSGVYTEKNEPGSEFGWWQIKQGLSFGLEYRL